jgi:hypothetical protein
MHSKRPFLVLRNSKMYRVYGRALPPGFYMHTKLRNIARRVSSCSCPGNSVINLINRIMIVSIVRRRFFTEIVKNAAVRLDGTWSRDIGPVSKELEAYSALVTPGSSCLRRMVLLIRCPCFGTSRDRFPQYESF